MIVILKHAYGILRAFFYKAPYIIAFAALFIYVGVQADKAIINSNPPEDYLKYTSFSVKGAYEGEDVFFTVCRERDENYRYEGDLNISVVSNPGTSEERTARAYSRRVGGNINPDPCENKVVLASDFKHEPGVYRMDINICFRVRYDIEKCTSANSDLYRIRPVPAELEERIQYFQNQVDQLNRQRLDGGVDASLSVPSNPSMTTNPSSGGNGGNGGNGGSGGNGGNGGNGLPGFIQGLGSALGSTAKAASDLLFPGR